MTTTSSFLPRDFVAPRMVNEDKNRRQDYEGEVVVSIYLLGRSLVLSKFITSVH